MATQEVYILLFGAVVLIIVFVAVLLYAIQRLRRRKTQLLDELKNSPRLNADRAFNRLEMARREADILGRQGTDLTRARELIAQSQSALDLRQFERSYELAQSAHESLVTSRFGPRTAVPLPSQELLIPRTTTRPPPGAASSSSLPPPAQTGLPRNRMESQFEMRLLASDLEPAKQTRPSDPATLAGIDLQEKARKAFVAEQYTEALRFALKGRRGLGGNVESVAPGPGPRPTTDGGVIRADPAQAAENAASGSRCPDCGYPTTPDDVFCRGCGAPRGPGSCPRCRTPRTPADTFCGRCGERFS